MNQTERHTEKSIPFYKKRPFYYVISFFVLIVGLHFFSQSLIRVEAPEPDLGKKVVITLPTGETVYTYENLIIEKDGKLLYKGERNTIDLTGGQVAYENWE